MQITADSSESLLNLKGIGPKVQEKLAKLSIYSIQDLLFHLPLRYEDRTRVVPIGSLRKDDECVVIGEVQLTEIKFGRRRMMLSRIHDGTGSLTLRFFNFSAAQKNNLERGTKIKCYGTVRRGSGGYEMIHPEYQRVSDDITNDDIITPVDEFLTAVYPTTDGLHQIRIRNINDQVIVMLRQGKIQLDEFVSDEALAKLNFPKLDESLLYVHQPPPDAPVDILKEGIHQTQKRLSYEELLAHYLSMARFREEVQKLKSMQLPIQNNLVTQFLSSLPFSLTSAQQRVVTEIESDLDKNYPMQRLVQGDVGSGKTVVAAISALHAIAGEYQAAMMAPTEILAEQHYQNFVTWFTPLDIKVGWLSGKMKIAEKRQALAAIADGDFDIVIGTHALFQEDVIFNTLALVIIDEQHRFGVHQRLALREKGKLNNIYPHQLIMTATPIPRTLAMTSYADLDCSIIDELPPGRIAIDTVVLSDNRRAEVVARVHQACKNKRQVYWVCALVEESESLQCEAAEDTANLLAESLPDIKIGLVHGRLKSAQKEQVMAQFKAGGIDLLVATTVIEVGVDVPNASLMIIENAERFGLAQLHQLRGRVGRGDQASACVLMYRGPLSKIGNERLTAMRESNDGFYLAQKDLELRGPGEVLGTRQTGMWQLKIADIQRDAEMLPHIRALASEMVKENSTAILPIIKRWMGNAMHYGNA
ncbi:ATP-dependent DNA helicase RecG [hydrothermal vent metagenome]|uniref:ATP-dependent DNA helicase RecG n=1 Tax=hydrothermal vent metagenome TaxID=652676 RepID=A0A3B1AIW2_9ZZZZ